MNDWSITCDCGCGAEVRLRLAAPDWAIERYLIEFARVLGWSAMRRGHFAPGHEPKEGT